MKAIVRSRYCTPDGLKLRDVERPVPDEGEALVRVHASSVNSADLEYLKGMSLIRVAAPFRPADRILGSDIAGVVEAVGAGVSQVEAGDRVWADLSEHGFGAFAEYVAAPEAALAPMPDGLTFEEAAAVPSAAVIALQGVRDYRPIETGDRVLVNGAGGGMGSFAVQLAASMGAVVTGVDSADKLDLVRSLGATEAIDFRREDYTTRGQQYQLIVDVSCYRSVRDSQRALTADGAYVVVGGSTPRVLQTALLGPMLSQSSEQEMGLLMGKLNRRTDLDDLAGMLEAGTIRPAIDRHYTLAEVPDALRYLAEGSVRGKAVIDIDHA